MADFYSNSIFWVDVDKVRPNPYQPRREFDQSKLSDLAESIRQYGVLQPLVVTRHEVEREDGGLVTEYELIAGERRLRASKLAGLSQVPVLIRAAEEQDRAKLELAIIENLQREDLNPIDRAHAFKRLVAEFNFSHSEIGRRVGKSRVYVSNTLRLLALPEEMQEAVVSHKISEGHTRPLLMLGDKPQEQETLFKEIMYRRLNVREAEQLARTVAVDKVRKASLIDPEMRELEEKLSDTLGTRVMIEGNREKGGRLVIKYFSSEDLRALLDRIERREQEEMMNKATLAPTDDEGAGVVAGPAVSEETSAAEAETENWHEEPEHAAAAGTDAPKDDRPDDDLYSIRNFSI